MALIRTVNLSQTYDHKETLKGIDLSIDRGEVFTIIGPTGAGKTTLIRVLDLLVPPQSGHFFFDGVDMTSPGAHRLEARRRMAYVQQRPLVFTMDVQDNVACGLKWRHIKEVDVRQRVDKSLELVGMASYRSRNARTLSGGETQLVAIARALITEPEVLFLDEPTANMDPVSTTKIEEVLAHIIQERKTTVVMTTHNMLQGQRMASRLGVLMNGELLQSGSVNEIFNKPTSRKVAEFVGTENILEGFIRRKGKGLTTISINGQNLSAITDIAVNEPVLVLARPEAISLGMSGELQTDRNVFECRVTKINSIGPSVSIEVSCGFPLRCTVTTQIAQELNISIGKHVYARFGPSAIHVIKR